MLAINTGLQFIRCSKYEYLIKKGSISNYSFNVRDEEKSGLLDLLFNQITYPAEEEVIYQQVEERLGDLDHDYIKSILDQLLDTEIMYEVGSLPQEQLRMSVITGIDHISMVEEKFAETNFHIATYVINPSTDEADVALDMEDEQMLAQTFQDTDYILLFQDHFSPQLFHKMNAFCLNHNKKLMISYLDGNEGIIIPLVNFNQVGCYNDFEIMRESSFYNLLDYQVMKERAIEEDPISQTNKLHLDFLLNHTILLLNQITTVTSINYYAYSLDFERLVNTKTRLLKFPKCPSCQGDKNLVHPFI